MPTIFSLNKTRVLTAALIGTASITFAAVNPSGSGADAARESVKRLTVAEGLEVTLFASEPMVRNPTDMDIDERGRVWITEGVNYRSTIKPWGILQTNGDRIVTLEDTNGDGSADKETVFYQDPSINSALGICVLGNRVIVSRSPHVFVLTDTDGDGKADKRELLFEDTTNGDHDHNLHAFVFGPDGKLYFNTGNEIAHAPRDTRHELRRPKGGPLTLPLNGPVPTHESEVVTDLTGNQVKIHGKPYREGLVFRCNPDGSEFETLAWNFRNNYEVAVDSFGTMWQSDNDDDGNLGVRINYVMEFGNFGYADEATGAGWNTGWRKAAADGVAATNKIYYEWHQYDPGVVPNLLHTGQGSPTGIAVYEGKLLPEIFRNQVIHTDAGPRVVRAYPVQTAGAGYQATITNILTASTNETWFRPSDVCVGPDGALYVADWNDAGVGGHNMRDSAVETMTGRIYRVAPKGSKLSMPKWNLTTAAGCVEALQSPNQSARALAWTKLHEMGSKGESALLKVWRGKEPRMRARALQLLARIKGSETKYVGQAIKDSDADIRITGLRIARELKLDVIPYVKTLTKDSSAQVRRECAIALRNNRSTEAPKLWAQLAAQHDPQNRWELEALGIGAEGQWDAYLDAWLAGARDKWNTPAGKDILWRSRAKKTPSYLAKLITDPNVTASDRARYFRSFDFISGPEKDAALLEVLASPAPAAK